MVEKDEKSKKKLFDLSKNNQTLRRRSYGLVKVAYEVTVSTTTADVGKPPSIVSINFDRFIISLQRKLLGCHKGTDSSDNRFRCHYLVAFGMSDLFNLRVGGGATRGWDNGICL